MKDIAIYGAGGLGREIACLINIINNKEPQWNLIGFFDDGIEKGSRNEYVVVLGGIDELNSYPEELAIVIAIASPKTVEIIVNKIHSDNIYFPNIIAPDLLYLDINNMSLGQGNIIGMKCTISCNVHINNFNLLNGSVGIGHDTIVGSYNSFMPGVKISGEVNIGDRNFFGTNSVVLQQISIGNDTIVGASSLILRKTKDGMTYVGNPASIIKY